MSNAKQSPAEQEAAALREALSKWVWERFGCRASTLSLDYILWMLGRNAAEPRHLTKTLAY